MNEKYLKLACDVITDRNLLVNLASKRAKELARGAHPMIELERGQRHNHVDIALREIAEGKIVAIWGE